MAKKIKIKRDENGNIQKWFGFKVFEKANQTALYLELGREKVSLKEEGLLREVFDIVSLKKKYQGKPNLESKVWEEIYRGCVKLFPERIICIDPIEVNEYIEMHS